MACRRRVCHHRVQLSAGACLCPSCSGHLKQWPFFLSLSKCLPCRPYISILKTFALSSLQRHSFRAVDRWVLLQPAISKLALLVSATTVGVDHGCHRLRDVSLLYRWVMMQYGKGWNNPRYPQNRTFLLKRAHGGNKEWIRSTLVIG